MADPRSDPLRRMQPLIVLGILTFVVFCLKIAQDVFIPLALAMLLTFLLTPVVEWLERRRLPRAAAVFVTVALAFTLVAGVAWLLTAQVSALAEDLPRYKGTITRKIREARRIGKGGTLERAQDTVKEVIGELQKDDPGAATRKPPPPVVVERSGDEIWRVPTRIGPIAELLGTIFLVVVLVIFMLAERQRLVDRVIRLGGTRRMTVTTKVLAEAARRISHYLAMQSLINGSFGTAIGIGLFFVGVPYALLFGVLAALLRFVPYVGAWLAASLPVVMALAVFPGWTQPFEVIALFAAVELTIYLAIEPFLLGHSAGVSPLALLITLAFWTWLWGPIGLVLGTPLTVCLVALGKHVPSLRFIVILFGDEPVVSPDVAFYQRLLRGDEDEAQLVLEEYVKTHPLPEAYERVLLPALCRARGDAARGAIMEDDAVAIAQMTARIIDELDDTVLLAARERDEPGAAAETRAADRLPVLACPARDELDAVALRMFALVAAAAHVEVDVTSPRLLAAELTELVRTREPAVVLVGSIPPGGVAHSRYVIKRMRAQFPDVGIVAARWSAPADDEARAQLIDAGATDVATSLSQARDLVLQYRRVRVHPARSPAA
jgi:predicted PurR-regulated permease PerM